MQIVRLLTAVALASSAASSQPLTIRELSPGLLIFQTSSGNVAAAVGPDGVLLIGTPSIESTPEINSEINSVD